MKILKERYDDPHVIHIEGRGDGFLKLVDLLLYCKYVGNSGHSFMIEADDGEFECGWDGDGADYIDLVKLDDKEMK